MLADFKVKCPGIVFPLLVNPQTFNFESIWRYSILLVTLMFKQSSSPAAFKGFQSWVMNQYPFLTLNRVHFIKKVRWTALSDAVSNDAFPEVTGQTIMGDG